MIDSFKVEGQKRVTKFMCVRCTELPGRTSRHAVACSSYFSSSVMRAKITNFLFLRTFDAWIHVNFSSEDSPSTLKMTHQRPINDNQIIKKIHLTTVHKSLSCWEWNTDNRRRYYLCKLIHSISTDVDVKLWEFQPW